MLGVPCVTLRDNTERPETLEAKSNDAIIPIYILYADGLFLNLIGLIQSSYRKSIKSLN